LPNGGSIRCESDAVTILDCILTDDDVFVVLDVLVWKDYNLCNSACEMRHYWVTSKITEETIACISSPNNPFRFEPLRSKACTKQSVADAYHAARDGILLVTLFLPSNNFRKAVSSRGHVHSRFKPVNDGMERFFLQ
jgi:hypothetical protein